MFTHANDYAFIKSIDGIIIDSDNDIKMKNAISFIDSKSKQKGVTIYQMIYELVQKDISEERAMNWLKSRKF